MKSLLAEPLAEYIQATWLREPEILRRLREETAALPNAGMQIAPEQGQLMALLVRALGVSRILEIGVFTGYSSLAMALALPEDGHLTACDVSDEYTSVARRYWAEAGVASKVQLHLAPGAETLERLIADRQGGSYDLAFIDADKTSYPTYVDLCHTLLKPNGLILIDNVLWSGRIVHSDPADADNEALRQLNEDLRHDERFELGLIPIADGLTVLRKR